MRQLQDKAKEAALGFQASVDQHGKKGRASLCEGGLPRHDAEHKKEGPPKRALKNGSVNRDQAVVV
jgi:hypothetical protein